MHFTKETWTRRWGGDLHFILSEETAEENELYTHSIPWQRSIGTTSPRENHESLDVTATSMTEKANWIRFTWKTLSCDCDGLRQRPLGARFLAWGEKYAKRNATIRISGLIAIMSLQWRMSGESFEYIVRLSRAFISEQTNNPRIARSRLTSSQHLGRQG